MFNSVRAFYQVMHDAKLSPSELDQLVHRRLQHVLVSAYRHVPYYRELMRSVGYDPLHAYAGPGDLQRLPITTKQHLKAHGIQAFVREGADLAHCFSDRTSGSSGIPLRIYRAPYERAVQIAKWLRVLFHNGYSVRDKVMSLTSPDRVAQEDSILQRLGIMRRLAVDFVHYPPEQMIELLLDYKPAVLYGNLALLELMAVELGRRCVRPVGLELVVATGEVITASARRLCREPFGVELVESYGSSEMGVMAYETPARDGLHLCEDLTYFEFLDGEGRPVPEGVPGRVVVTDLLGTLMPFVRYDHEDLAVCRVDSDSPGAPRRLTQVVGRTNDLAVLPGGEMCTRLPFDVILKKFDEIRQYRIVQRTPELFEIHVAADGDYLEAIRGDLLCRLQEHFPPTLSFEIVGVQRLDPDPTGKLRVLISEVGERATRSL